METVQALDIYLLVFTSFSSTSSHTEQMGAQRFFEQNWSYYCTTLFWEAAAPQLQRVQAIATTKHLEIKLLPTDCLFTSALE